jgi:hypothetical protein
MSSIRLKAVASLAIATIAHLGTASEAIAQTSCFKEAIDRGLASDPQFPKATFKLVQVEDNPTVIMNGSAAPELCYYSRRNALVVGDDGKNTSACKALRAILPCFDKPSP